MAYKHITKEERFYIEQRIALGDSIPKIAQELSRHKSSLYREIQRNTDVTFGFYSGLRADNIANARLVETVRKESFFDTKNKNHKKIHDFLVTKLKVRSSPEQISTLFKSNFGTDVSHQTIYRYIRTDRANGGGLFKHLRRRGKKYRVRTNKVDKVKNKVSIEKRDQIDVLAQDVGHYEIDTIFGFEQKSFLLTMVDIKSKYSIIVKIPNKEAQTVYNAIKHVMATTLLPFKSFTSDNGTEFAEHEKITQETGVKWYFCHPYSSFERGLNENTNGLIRDFYPKRTDFRKHTEQEFLELQNILNNRPRKTLGYKTPVQVMVQHMMATE